MLTPFSEEAGVTSAIATRAALIAGFTTVAAPPALAPYALQPHCADAQDFLLSFTNDAHCFPAFLRGHAQRSLNGTAALFGE